MTRMIPDVIHPDIKSRAERRIFEWISSASGTDAWLCLHSLALAQHETQRAGEIDFLLITNHAVLVLEVKGGRVERRDGVWRHTNRFGEVHRTSRSPFVQARDAMFSLERRIAARFGRDHDLSRLLFGYGVIAPDCALRGMIDRFDLGESNEALIDCDNLTRGVIRCVQQLTAWNQQQQSIPRRAPRTSDAEALARFLRGDFDAVVPYRVWSRDAHEQYKALEPEQYDVLDMLKDEPRLLVEGSAGTGKTVLAVESARRAAWKGRQRVLLLCYNRLLAARLRQLLDGDEIVVQTIHAFGRQLVLQSAERERYAQAERELSSQEVFLNVLPKYAAIAALEVAEEMYDVIVVDESQDLLEPWALDVMDAVLKGGLSKGSWQLFLDSNNQAAVFGRYDESLVARLGALACRQRLVLNVRNTRQIAKESFILARPRSHARARIEGTAVTYDWYETPQQQGRRIGRIIDRLINHEGATPECITVLSPLRQPSWLASYRGEHPIAPVGDGLRTDDSRAVGYTTVSSYKGLENDIIILTDVDSLDSDRDRAIVYVGMTRARVQLYVLLPEELRTEYRMLIIECLEDEEKHHV